MKPKPPLRKKYCPICKKTYNLKIGFYKSRRSKDGRQYRCKFCQKVYNKIYEDTHQDKRNAYKKKQYQLKLKERKTYYTNYNNTHQKEHKIYQKENLDAYAARSSKYRALKRKQLPKLSKQQKEHIQLYYKVSYWLGSHFHVDHKQPLTKGGLHTPKNLQIIPKHINHSKYNNENYIVPNNQIIRLPDKYINKEKIKCL